MAAVLELLSEPLFILANTQLAFGVRAAVDSAANIAKCGVTLALVLHTPLDPALVFSVAALVFSGLTSLGYFLYGLQLRRQVCVCVCHHESY
jgi:oligosaccharide translocation protein RFT1